MGYRGTRPWALLRRTASWSAWTVLWLGILPAPGLGQQDLGSEAPFFGVAAGYFDVGGASGAVEVRVEHRPNARLLGLGPWLLAGATNHGAGGVFAGVFWGFRLGRGVVFTPSTGVGLWSSGDGKELGSVVEFRSTAEVTVRLSSGAQIGASLTHLSNAGIGRRNPGANSLTASYAIPIR